MSAKSIKKRPSAKKYCYMAVTLDQYEEPIAVGDTMTELEGIMKLSKNTISNTLRENIHPGEYKSYCKFVKVLNIDDDEE